MTETNIYFVRHAESPFSLENEATRGLSKKGWNDSRMVTELLVKEGITHIYSSSYVRAIQSVEGLAKKLQLDVKLDHRFRECCLAENHQFEDHQGAIRFALDHPDFAYPGGETSNEVKDRGTTALREIVQTYNGGKIVIGIHGNIMTNIMNYFDAKYDLEFWRGTTKPDIYQLCISEDFKLVNTARLWNATQKAR